MRNKITPLFLVVLSVFNTSAFAGLPEVDSAVRAYMDNRSPRELNEVRKAVRQLEREGIQTKLGPVLSLTDDRLKQKVDHYIEVAENMAPSANAASLRNIGRVCFVGAFVAVAACSMMAPKSPSQGYAVQPVESSIATAGK